jgi:hypothetical protein
VCPPSACSWHPPPARRQCPRRCRRGQSSRWSPVQSVTPRRISRDDAHVTRHTSHVTRHTSHVTRHTSHVTRHAAIMRATFFDIVSISIQALQLRGNTVTACVSAAMAARFAPCLFRQMPLTYATSACSPQPLASMSAMMSHTYLLQGAREQTRRARHTRRRRTCCCSLHSRAPRGGQPQRRSWLSPPPCTYSSS